MIECSVKNATKYRFKPLVHGYDWNVLLQKTITMLTNNIAQGYEVYEQKKIEMINSKTATRFSLISPFIVYTIICMGIGFFIGMVIFH